MLPVLDKPEYLFNPRQLLRRLAFALRGRSAAHEWVTLPWGTRLQVNPKEALGLTCCTLGIYDLAVTETLFRLIDPRDFCVDAGANIGHMTLAMVHCAGPNGFVLGFEPYAPLYQELVANIASPPNVQLECLALSSREGTASLSFPDDFPTNQGTASLRTNGGGGESVRTVRLDSYISGRPVGLLKIDVEGHEFDVLTGCGDLLGLSIRDIVFEEHRPYPAGTHLLLKNKGYSLYRIDRSILSPLLLPADSAPTRQNVATSFLATTSPKRAESRFAHLGWRALRKTRSRTSPAR